MEPLISEKWVQDERLNSSNQGGVSTDSWNHQIAYNLSEGKDVSLYLSITLFHVHIIIQTCLAGDNLSKLFIVFFFTNS